MPYDEANVHVLTHSLHYGLAVFEGMRCYKCDDGQLRNFSRQRAYSPACRIRAHRRDGDSVQLSEELLKACADVVRVNKFAECYLRPMVFYRRRRDGSIGAWQ